MTIFEVKIYNEKGDLKRVVEKEKAGKLFWSQFLAEGGGLHNHEVDKEILKQNGKKINCKKCNKEVYVTGKNTKFCSLKCKTELNKKKSDLRLLKKSKKNCQIEGCSATFITSGKQKYCSKPCRKIANKLKNREMNETCKAKLKKIKQERYGYDR